MPAKELNCGQRCNLIWCYEARIIDYSLWYCSLNPKYFCGQALLLHWLVRILLAIFVLCLCLLANS